MAEKVDIGAATTVDVRFGWASAFGLILMLKQRPHTLGYDEDFFREEDQA